MAIRNATANFTFEQWRVEFNELATDVGDINSGITGSVPSSSPTYTTVEAALEGLVTDVNSIIDGTHNFTGNATFGGNVDISGNLTIGGLITIGDNAASDRITVNASLVSDLIPEGSRNIGSTGSPWHDIHINGIAILATAEISDLTTGKFLVAGTNGRIESDNNLSFSGNTLVATNISVGTEATLATAKVSNISSGQIPIAGTAGLLAGDTDLTFSGSTLTTTNLSVGTSATIGSAKVSDLTSGRILLAGTAGELEDSAGLTYDGTTLAVTGAATFSTTLGVTQTLNVTGDATFGDDVTVTDNLLVSGSGQSTSSTTGSMTVAGGAGIVKDLYVGGSIFAGSNISIAGSTPFGTEGFSIAMSVALG